MVAFLSRQRLNLPVAPSMAAVFALFTALLFAVMPGTFLEGLALDSGIAAVLPAAEPPLGLTARAVLVLLCGGSVGLVAWFGLFLLFGGRTVTLTQPTAQAAAGDVPVLRRADAHPDAPPRRPLLANRDLGTPFLDVHAARPADAIPAVQPLPRDLDLPLAAFDPAAIPDEPADWFPAPAQLTHTARKQTFDRGERFETFALPPLAAVAMPDPERPAPPPARPAHDADYDSSASIHALLDRLERGVGRRAVPIAPPRMRPDAEAPRGESLEEALVSLRRMATRG